MTHDPVASTMADPKLEQRLTSGASWFFWIAGTSILNSIITHSGGKWSLLIGLGLTQLVDATFTMAPALSLDLLIAGVFVAFGVFAHRRQGWAFMAGLIVYALDGLLLLTVADWLGTAMHALGLFYISLGYGAYREQVAPSAAAAPLPSGSAHEG